MVSTTPVKDASPIAYQSVITMYQVYATHCWEVHDHLLFCHLGQYPSCPSSLASTPSCSTTCRDGYSVEYGRDKHYGSKYYWVSGHQNIMKELYSNGPVEATFLVYEDFLYYKSGANSAAYTSCNHVQPICSL